MNTKRNTLLNFVLFMMFTIASGILIAPDAGAFQKYKNEQKMENSNCAACHGNFTDATSPMGTMFPGGSKHEQHRSASAMNTDCNLCHTNGNQRNPFMNSSDGTNNTPGLGCVGCHGRDYDGAVGVIGAGLRAHHAQAGITVCAGCHPNDPVPLGEDVNPPYYGSPDTLANDSCNSSGLETWSLNTSSGLDNDGDGLYDGDDPDCVVCIPTGTPETVCNGVDDDCDSLIDEDFTSNPTTCGTGECFATGNTTCVDGVEGDTCTPGTPSAELCDGLDNNCDGSTDEAFPNLGMMCTVGIGECEASGAYVCTIDGTGTECDATPGTPAPEICDNLDNDCDGIIDNVIPQPTTCGLGECAATGQTTCTGGVEGDTCTPGTPVPEVCNDNLDNDCDGLIDGVLGDPNACSCITTMTPETICNGVDDDCDGSVDEDYMPMATTCGNGVCASTGMTECVGGVEGDTCTPGPQDELTDVTCDGLDGDCDGLVDEDFMAMATTCGNGVCASTGTTECVGGVEGDTCTPGPQNEPSDVTCDGLDGDCDGLVDEDFMAMATTCGNGVCASTGTTECVGGVEGDTCTPGPQNEPSDVTCDGLDGDCDGLVDEDFVQSTTTCGLGVCESTGLLTCQNGGETDNCVTGLPAEDPEATCNDNLDNDCDGLTDAAQDPDCGAQVIPPPVRQNIGFPDSSIADLTEADCRFCHEDPNIVDDANIPNRHHLLIGTPVPDPTVRPFPGGDTNGNYECYSCHNLAWDPVNMSYQFETFRDCIFCHNTGSPHHMTAQALAQNCDACHGPVDNPFDGHFIPDYPPSLVTPTRSQGDGLPLNSRGNGAGACNYCHDSGLTVEGIMADTNMNLHHNTGLLQAGMCAWCHNFGLPFDEQIRVCERCHGINSLHNIQADSDATGLVDTDGDGIGDTDNIGNIIPNMENQYWGHIGSNDDCWGCHGFSVASAPGSGPVIPDISVLSAYSIPAGTDTGISIGGSSFTNTVQTPQGPVTLNSVIVLTAADGSTTTLTPDAISSSSMDVTIPGTLAAGNYTLRAVKLSNDSNAVNIAVTPPVTITDASCNKKKGVLTITGSGFGSKPEGTDADIYVEVNGNKVDIISWTDTRIKVSVSNCPNGSAIKVKALFGTATSSGSGGKPPKPCKGKKC